MNTSAQSIHQQIQADITRVQVDLEAILQQLFEQAGSKIAPEQRETLQQEMAHTQKLLESLKSKYVQPSTDTILAPS